MLKSVIGSLLVNIAMKLHCSVSRVVAHAQHAMEVYQLTASRVEIHSSIASIQLASHLAIFSYMTYQRKTTLVMLK